MNKIISTVSIVVALGLFSGCVSSGTSLPQSISVKAPKLHPEGISYSDKQKAFYLSSIYQGKIVKVGLNGTIEDFAQDDSLVSVIGVHVDKKRGRLLVCNADSGFGAKSSAATTGRLAQVVIYDLESRKKLQTIDLAHLYPGGHFANDLTFDDVGNIYVTDSFSPVIYKIDTAGKATLLTENAQFQAPKGSFGLNGIVYHDGYLIVGKADVGELYKVSIENPSDVSEVILDQAINSVDGLLLQEDKALILVTNNFTGQGFDEAVYKIVSDDDWKSGRVVASKKIEGGVFPTTVTEVNGKVYVNYSHLPELAQKKPTVEQFQIERIDF